MSEGGEAELLGVVTAPSGILVLIDAGLLGIWEGARADIPDTIDFRIDGPDAEEAGRRFERAWHPLYWYDIPRTKAADAQNTFASFVKSAGLSARLVEVPGGVPYGSRIDLALERGGGRAGLLEFFRVEAPVFAGLPRDRKLPVRGFRMAEGSDRDRWRWVTLEIDDDDTVESKEIGRVMVDEARLMFADAGALKSWTHLRSLDGKADYVFWGRDAAKAAALHDAPQLTDQEFGWLDLRDELAIERGTALEEMREREGLKFAGDYRPHSDHHRALVQMRASATGSGVVEVGGATMCAFFTSWGDGAFPVFADLGSEGQLLRIRVQLGDDS